jgi:hypothetical protein
MNHPMRFNEKARLSPSSPHPDPQTRALRERRGGRSPGIELIYKHLAKARKEYYAEHPEEKAAPDRIGGHESLPYMLSGISHPPGGSYDVFHDIEESQFDPPFRRVRDLLIDMNKLVLQLDRKIRKLEKQS